MSDHEILKIKHPIPSDLNQKNWFWGHTFPHICGFIGPIISSDGSFLPELVHLNATLRGTIGSILQNEMS